jgi:hypothetical protein
VFVVQKNILRRNLTVGQRAAVGFELKERLKKIPPHGGKHQSRGEASAKAAAASQTTIDNIQRYEHLEEKAPELAKEVKAGKRSLRGAVKQQREVEKATPEAVAVAGLTQEKALERIMEVCGRPFYNSIIEDQISGLRTTSEVAAFAKLGDKEMNDLRGPLVRSQMTLAKARKFLEDRSDNNGELVVDWEWTAREFISLKPEAKKAGEVKERCVKMLKTPRGWYRWTMELVEPPPENSNGEEEQ